MAPGGAHGVQVCRQAIGKAEEHLRKHEQHVQKHIPRLQDVGDDPDNKPPYDTQNRGVFGAEFLCDARGDKRAHETAQVEHHEDGSRSGRITQDDFRIVRCACSDCVVGDEAQDVVEYDADEIRVGDDIFAHRLERNLLAFRFGFGVVALRGEEADSHRDDVDDRHDGSANGVGKHTAYERGEGSRDQRHELRRNHTAECGAGAQAARQERALGRLVGEHVGHAANARVRDVPAEVAHDITDADDDACHNVAAHLGEAHDEEHHGDDRGDDEPGAVLTLLEVELVDEHARQKGRYGVDG